MNGESLQNDPHAGQPVLTRGAPQEQARAAMIMIHGRGSTAREIISLAGEFNAQGMVFLAPQAAGNVWYPNGFMTPVAANEPWLSFALAKVTGLLATLKEGGLGADRVLLLGFSQGACLALEAMARSPQRYGGVAGLSGALIENGDRQRDYTGDLQGTPILLGCSDVDFHIPVGRVDRTEQVLQALGATVDKRIYPGMGHTVNEDEIAAVQAMIDAVLA